MAEAEVGLAEGGAAAVPSDDGGDGGGQGARAGARDPLGRVAMGWCSRSGVRREVARRCGSELTEEVGVVVGATRGRRSGDVWATTAAVAVPLRPAGDEPGDRAHDAGAAG